MGNEADVLVEIAKNTESELVVFIILVIVFIVAVVPIYTLILRDRKQKNQLENDRLSQYMERERRIIEVITANTTTAAELKTLIVEVRTTLEHDRVTLKDSLGRVHGRIDKQSNLCTHHGETLARMSTMLDEMSRTNTGTKDNVKQILTLVTDKGCAI